MKKNELWHRPKLLDNGNILIKLTKKHKEVEVKLCNNPKEIKTLGEAIAFITKYPHNLMRVSGYKCDKHKRFHRYTFHSCVSMGFPQMFGFDKPNEVIKYAKSWSK